MEDLRVQNDPRVMVWCGILGDSIIGPFFFRDSVNMQTYLHMLKHDILPGKQALQDQQRVWFMHDGAPAHYSKIFFGISSILNLRIVGSEEQALSHGHPVRQILPLLISSCGVM